MQIICAWCNKSIAIAADFTRPGRSVDISHGICPSCSEIIIREATRQLLDRLIQLEEPLLLLDHEGRIQLANPPAVSLLNLLEPDGVGQSLRDVLGCRDCPFTSTRPNLIANRESCHLGARIEQTLRERCTIEGPLACLAQAGAATARIPLILKTRFVCERVLLSFQPGAVDTPLHSLPTDPTP